MMMMMMHPPLTLISRQVKSEEGTSRGCATSERASKSWVRCTARGQPRGRSLFGRPASRPCCPASRAAGASSGMHQNDGQEDVFGTCDAFVRVMLMLMLMLSAMRCDAMRGMQHHKPLPAQSVRNRRASESRREREAMTSSSVRLGSAASTS